MRMKVPLGKIARSLWSFWDNGRKVERTAYLMGTLLLVSGLLHLVILTVGGGTWMGPLSLRKPTTFGLSFGLTLMTIAWVSSFLRLGARVRVILLSLFTITCAIETALVSLQAWRGVPSHYNVETTFDGLVARTLAAGGVALVVIIAVLTLAALRANPTISAGLRIAIRAGFIALCSAVSVGALMIAKGMLLVFAGNSQAAYVTGGTLKPTHAVTMHAILVLPLLAWLLSFTAWNERRQLEVVLLATAGYTAFAGVVAVVNSAGLDLSQAPSAAITIGGGGLLALAAAWVIALVGVARSAAGAPRQTHA